MFFFFFFYCILFVFVFLFFFFFQAEDGIRDFCLSRGLGDVYKRQPVGDVQRHDERHRKLRRGTLPRSRSQSGWHLRTRLQQGLSPVLLLQRQLRVSVSATRKQAEGADSRRRADAAVLAQLTWRFAQSSSTSTASSPTASLCTSAPFATCWPHAASPSPSTTTPRVISASTMSGCFRRCRLTSANAGTRATSQRSRPTRRCASRNSNTTCPCFFLAPPMRFAAPRRPCRLPSLRAHSVRRSGAFSTARSSPSTSSPSSRRRIRRPASRRPIRICGLWSCSPAGWRARRSRRRSAWRLKIRAGGSRRRLRLGCELSASGTATTPANSPWLTSSLARWPISTSNACVACYPEGALREPLVHSFSHAALSSDVDIAMPALLIARIEYPTLDVRPYLNQLDVLGREACLRLGAATVTPGGHTPPRVDPAHFARVQALNRYLFDELQFTGNTANYGDPRNSFLNEVLERRTGIPIS